MTYNEPITAAEIAELMISQIDQPGQRYNCECRVGGVDAISIDTDWLLHNLRLIRDFASAGPSAAEVDRALTDAKASAWFQGYSTGEANATGSIRAGVRIVSDNPYLPDGAA